MDDTRHRSPEKLAEFRALLNLALITPTGRAWDSMDSPERVFWLQKCRLHWSRCDRSWFELSADERRTITHGIARCASRALAIQAGVTS